MDQKFPGSCLANRGIVTEETHRDDTMRLDQASSRDQLTAEDPAVNRSNDMSILKIAKKDQMQERSLDATTSSKVIRSSLEASQRTEEAQR